MLGDLRDERGELFDLEAEGAAPQVAPADRALASADGDRLPASLAGALTGLVLGAVVVDLVALTARATLAEPPLLLDVDWSIVALAVAGLRDPRRDS